MDDGTGVIEVSKWAENKDIENDEEAVKRETFKYVIPITLFNQQLL